VQGEEENKKEGRGGKGREGKGGKRKKVEGTPCIFLSFP